MRKKTQKIYKEWKDATWLEIWEGIRDNFTFGFIGATLVVLLQLELTLQFYLDILLITFSWVRLSTDRNM